MLRNYLKQWLHYGVLSMLLGSVIMSCGDDDDAEPETNTPDFEASVSTTYKVTAPTGIPVTFTDKSQNAAAYSWDFGDGSALSTEQSPVHIYRLPGTYQVELTTGAASGFTPTTAKKTLEVVVADPTASLSNLVQGGDLEAADEAKWTRIRTGQKTDGVLTDIGFSFGSTTNKPANGNNGGLNVSVPAGIADGGEAGTLWFQELELAAGVYKFSADIKHGVETPAGGNRSFKDYWFEVYLGTEVPFEGDGYNHDATAALTGFINSGWLGESIPANNKPWPATDGALPQTTWFWANPEPQTGPKWMSRKAATIADSNGVFSLAAGTYHLVIKAGFGGSGGFGANGITLDNVRLVKIP